MLIMEQYRERYIKMAYEIRYCKENELEKLVSFIKNHWKEDHVFVKNTELLKWQHFDEKYKRYNFVVAYNTFDEEFDGILGFIPLSHYDTKISNNDTWLAIWKVNELKTKGHISGMDLLYFLKKDYKPNSIGSLGISDIAKEIYKVLRYNMGFLNHYYIINEDIKKTFICDVKNIEPRQNIFDSDTDLLIKELKDISELNNLYGIYYPYKTPDYIVNRYINHPIYSYNVLLISKGDNPPVCAFVIRKINVSDRMCIRIVDVLGDLKKLSNINRVIQRYLQDQNAEYIDLMNTGIDQTVFEELGFMKKGSNDIIPNYFEPFLRENIEVAFAYRGYKDYIFFKGDSDQDRPNMIQ